MPANGIAMMTPINNNFYLYQFATPLTVTWTSTANPAYFIVNLGYRVGNTGTGVRDSVAGNIRTVSLPTSAIPAGATALAIDTQAVGSETLSGDVVLASRLRLFATTESRNVTFTS